jgi:AcrR family transcriptional regulator
MMSSQSETTRKILDATLSCTETGSDFSMADVASAAGLSRQAVYLHFPDRAGLLTALLARTLAERPVTPIEDAPSARAALNALVARLAETYPRTWPVVRALGGDAADAGLAAACHVLAGRFREEGALAAHLAPQAAADLLSTLLSLAVWKELVVVRGWDSARYKSHIAFLAAGAVTR